MEKNRPILQMDISANTIKDEFCGCPQKANCRGFTPVENSQLTHGKAFHNITLLWLSISID